MRKLGLIGGMGPESTLLYYRKIAAEYQKREPHGGFPILTIETVNMYEMLDYCYKKDYSGLTEYLLKAIGNAVSAGAEFIAMASNTPHVVFDELQKRSNISMLSIVEPTYRAIKKMGLKRIGWLGTAFTMEEDYFKKQFTANEMEVIVPNKSQREYIDEKISKELEFGVIKEDTKYNIDTIIKKMIEQERIQGIILGCTELPLLYKNADMPVPCFDTVEYHIEGIVDYMLEEYQGG